MGKFRRLKPFPDYYLRKQPTDILYFTKQTSKKQVIKISSKIIIYLISSNLNLNKSRSILINHNQAYPFYIISIFFVYYSADKARSQIKTLKIVTLCLVGIARFELAKWRSQSPLPYRLAISQYNI